MNTMSQRDEKRIMMCSSVHVWVDTRIYYKEAKTLALSGYQLDFYAIEHSTKKEVVNRITMHYLEKKKRLKRFQHWKFLYNEMIKSNAKNFHFHDSELLVVALFLKRKLKKEIFIVYDMHEHLPAAIKTKQWIPKFSRNFISKIIEKVEKYLMKSCDAVIFAEKSYKKHYTNLNLKKIDVLNYPLVERELPRKKENDFLTLIYVGVLTEQRGLFNMLELAKHLKANSTIAFKLKLIGPIFTKKHKINQFIKENQLENVLEFYGRMQYNDIWMHYSQADIGLCLLHPTPNNLNSQSTKLFEYMAAGLPIIASDFSSFTKLLTLHQCGKTGDIFNYEELGELVLEILDKSDERLTLGENGRNAFEQYYSWINEGEKLRSLYNYT